MTISRANQTKQMNCGGKTKRMKKGGPVEKAYKALRARGLREQKRNEIMGREGAIEQDRRRLKSMDYSGVGGILSQRGGTLPKASDTVKRVGEYKAAKAQKVASRTKKMAHGGKVCRGMGAATRGGKFGRDG